MSRPTATGNHHVRDQVVVGLVDAILVQDLGNGEAGLAQATDLGPDVGVGDVVHPSQLVLRGTPAVVEEGAEVVSECSHFVSFRVVLHRTGQLWPLSGPESTVF